MKVSLQSLSRVALALLALSMTVSCLPGSGPFARRTLVTDGAAVVDGASAPGARTYRAPVVASTGFFFGSSRGFYDRGYGYGSRSLCSTCGYNPCRCSSRHRSGSGYSRSRSDSGGHDHSKHPHAHDTYAIAGGSVGTKTKPTGFHSLDWYKSRGYDTSRLKLVNEHGQAKGHSQSKSKSSSSGSKSKSSSSGSKSKSSGSSSRSKSSSSKSSGGSSSSKKQGGKSRR